MTLSDPFSDLIPEYKVIPSDYETNILPLRLSENLAKLSNFFSEFVRVLYLGVFLYSFYAINEELLVFMSETLIILMCIFQTKRQ